MPELPGTETHHNLEVAFARESQAAMRYRFFAQQADIEGAPETASLFRSLADGATGHALGHLELLAEFADPATGQDVEDVAGSVASALASETEDHATSYPAIAATAHHEGFGEVGAWLDTVAKADHVARLAAESRSAPNTP